MAAQELVATGAIITLLREIPLELVAVVARELTSTTDMDEPEPEGLEESSMVGNALVVSLDVAAD